MPPSQSLNSLAASLADTLDEHRCREKWLLAPSRRIGQQWLQAVAQAGRPALNVHMFTFPALAMSLAAGEMAARGLTAALGEQLDWWAELAWQSLDDEAGRQMPRSRQPSLTTALRASLEAVRLSGLGPDQLRQASWEQPGKGEHLAALLDSYLQLLAQHARADYADVLRMAADALRRDGLPRDVLLLVPDQLEQWDLERKLIGAAPTDRLVRLELDQPRSTRGDDLSGLSWIESPAAAPPPHRDGTAAVFRAVGECNEVREVLRRILDSGTPLDQVELLHVDSEAYVPLLIELSQSLAGDAHVPTERADTAGALAGGFAITVADGVPAGYSRPGRALLLWLRWAADGCPQRILVDLLQEGLWHVPSAGTVSSHQLATLLRELPIGRQRERYLSSLDRRIAAQRRRWRAARQGEDTEPEQRQRLAALLLLRRRLERLLRITPLPTDPPAIVLARVDQFLQSHVHRTTKLDLAACGALATRAERLRQWLEATAADQWDVWPWLRELAAKAPVLGSGPRPGALHVAHALRGGHSQRPVTFVVGLDDTRFPGAGHQDPVLLDEERRQLSAALPLGIDQPQLRTEHLARMLAGLRGRVTLSCASQTLIDDRPLFPSPPLAAAVRILQQAEHRDWQQPTSFAPADPARAISRTEWWLSRLCPAPGAAALAEADNGYEHLARGRAALQARRGDSPSEFNGWVPQAADELAPLQLRRGWSASAMETAGKCPLRFLFRYGMRVFAPEDPPLDDDRWLDPRQYGSLLHEVFRQFMSDRSEAGELPDFQQHHQRLAAQLQQALERERERILPPSESAFRQQARQMQQAARVFLDDEQRNCRSRRPRFFEAAVGMPNAAPTALDVDEPLLLDLGDGRQLLAIGMIDRIDQLADSPGDFEVWDYKTGSAWGYKASAPFSQGRHVQNVFYRMLTEQALRRQVDKSAEVVLFGYFFPGGMAWGQRISWTAAQLEGGAAVLRQLAEVMGSGAYLPTWDPKTDCRYCDYRAACGGSDGALRQLGEASRRQAAEDATALTAAWKELKDGK